MISVVISGFYGFDNSGDEAILQAIVEQFREREHDINITVLSAKPQDTARIYNVRSVDRRKFSDIYKAIKNSDALISGGGSLLQDVTSVHSIWYYMGIMIMAFWLRKPVYAFAQGIGPVQNKFNKVLFKHVMKRVKYISVRDEMSKHELVKLGVNRDVECTADPALMLQPASTERRTEILRNEGVIADESKPKIGFYIRSWKSKVDAADIFAQLADRVIDELNADVVFIPFHYDEDIATATQIINKMKNNALLIKNKYLPSEIMSVVGVMDMCIAVRLHGIIFSTKMGVPAVAISYDPKVDSYMHMVGMQPASSYNSLQTEHIYKCTMQTWGERKHIGSSVKQIARELEDKARKGIEQILDDINNTRNRP